MSLTAVIAVVGTAIALGELISAYLTYLDTRRQRRLDDVTKVLGAQREATEERVVFISKKPREEITEADYWYLKGIIERCEAAVDAFEDPSGWQQKLGSRNEHLRLARQRESEARKRLEAALSDISFEVETSEGAGTQGATVQEQLAALAQQLGYIQRPENTAYTPFVKDSSKNNVLMLSPRKDYVLTRIRLDSAAASASRLEQLGFTVGNYSKDGFLALKITEADLGDSTRAAELRNLLVHATPNPNSQSET